MKRRILLLLMVSMYLGACNKDSNIEEAGEEVKQRYPVSFSLSDFIKQVEILNDSSARRINDNKLNRDSSLSQVTDIYYLVFTQAGDYLANYKHQNVSLDSVNFGEIRDTLYSDSYVIYLLASDSTLNITTANSQGPGIIESNIQNGKIVSFNDLFYKKLHLNLEKGNMEPQVLSLNRIVGNLRVEVLDATVSPDYEVTVTVTGENSRTYLHDLNPVIDMIPTYYNMDMTRISPTVFSNNIINATGQLSVTITARNTITGAQIQEVVEHVNCYKNKKTTVTGSLNIPGAPLSSGKEFQIKVNDSWNPNDNVIAF